MQSPSSKQTDPVAVAVAVADVTRVVAPQVLDTKT